MAAEGNVITFIFTGEDDEVVPRNATRFIAHESLRVIPARLFYLHPNIVELICHAGVETIEERAFKRCRRLRRLTIPGVKIFEREAFMDCNAVTYVECPMLERIGGLAFWGCKSLSNINLPSAKVVERAAFNGCLAITDVKFGKDLESIRMWLFHNCPSLERITIPLKNGLIADDNVFQGCVNLKYVDLVEETVLRETVAALLLEEWRNDMEDEIDSINQILPSSPAGTNRYRDGDVGEKAATIRAWISRVLRKIIRCKAQHGRLLNEAATSLMHTLPNDIVINHVLPFLELPSHTFEGEDEDDIDI